MDDLIHLFVLNNLENAQGQQFHNNARHPRDPFVALSEKQFINMFRLSKQLCNFLIDTLKPLMRPKLRNTDLDEKTRVNIFFSQSSCTLNLKKHENIVLTATTYIYLFIYRY